MIQDLIQQLAQTDTEILRYLNGMYTAFGDTFMYLFTGKLIWIPMYASILYVLCKNLPWKVTLCYVIGIALTITFADQMCDSIIRPWVGRLRPSNLNNPISEWVHIVNDKRGGIYGFPSCHAANSFGLAIFLTCLFKKKSLSIFILIWAFINSYTRLYLGLHYPGDLLVGGIIGGLGAWGIYHLAHRAAGMVSTQTESTRNWKDTSVIIYIGLITAGYMAVEAMLKNG